MISKIYTEKEMRIELKRSGFSQDDVNGIIRTVKVTDIVPSLNIDGEKFSIYRIGFMNEDDCKYHVI